MTTKLTHAASTTVLLAVLVPLSSAPAASPPSASHLAPIHGPHAPKIDPQDFVRRTDTRYFPLIPGTRFRYEGVAENGRTPQTDVMVVTHRTKRILGIRSTVVLDTVSSRGRTIE